MNPSAGKRSFAVFFIVSALVFISMLLPSILLADDKQPETPPTAGQASAKKQATNVLFKSQFFTDLLDHGLKESEKRIEWNTGYDILKYHNLNGHLTLREEERSRFIDEEFLNQGSESVKNDIQTAFGHTLQEDLRNLPFVVKLEKSLRSATSFKAKQESPKDKFEFLPPSLRGKAVETEMEIDRMQRELDLLGELNSPKGQLKKLSLTRDIRQLKSEIAKYYPFRTNISARTTVKRDSGKYVGKITPYLKTAYRNWELETRYNLRNKTESGISDFEFVLTGPITPDIEISIDYEPMSKKVTASGTALFEDSILQINYTLGYEKQDNSLGASYTKILGKNMTVVFSALAIQNKEPSGRTYQSMANLSYRF